MLSHGGEKNVLDLPFRRFLVPFVLIRSFNIDEGFDRAGPMKVSYLAEDSLEAILFVCPINLRYIGRVVRKTLWRYYEL